MAVANKLSHKPVQKVETTKYMANGMQVTLTPGTVKNYLGSVGIRTEYPDQEVAMFINRAALPVLIHGFVKRTALSTEMNRQLAVGKDAYFKRAEAHAKLWRHGSRHHRPEWRKQVRSVTDRELWSIPRWNISEAGGSIPRGAEATASAWKFSFDEYVGKKKDEVLLPVVQETRDYDP